MSTTPLESYGYLTMVKTMAVEALKKVFDDNYTAQDFRGVHISIEYPIEEAHYPGIWVDYTDAGKLQASGIDHREYRVSEDLATVYTRWKFSGYLSFTITALTSVERDRLYDEVVKILAFSRFDEVRGRFRKHIETNPFIGATLNFDQIEPQGNAAAPGTPWGTDEIIYERTINMEVTGEFVSDQRTGDLVLLSEIRFVPHVLLPGEEPEEVPDDEAVDGPTAWH